MREVVATTLPSRYETGVAGKWGGEKVSGESEVAHEGPGLLSPGLQLQGLPKGDF